MPRLEIDCPDELLRSSTQTKAALEKLALESFLVRLFHLGEISSGRASELLHISRRDFLDLLGRYGVDVFDSEIDVEAEAGRGR
jgi:predicted HTH domain antitoxin